jgi:hypothetical protein
MTGRLPGGNLDLSWVGRAHQSDDPRLPDSLGPSEWTVIVQRAWTLSEQQNSGSANYTRVCDPTERTCSINVFYHNDAGQAASVLTRQDLTGRLVQRRLCEMNEFNDVRTCRDWDTEETVREVKNEQGSWVSTE